jgi:cytochrome c5
MNYPFAGLHHSPARVSGTQEDVDFSTTVVGQRNPRNWPNLKQLTIFLEKPRWKMAIIVSMADSIRSFVVVAVIYGVTMLAPAVAASAADGAGVYAAKCKNCHGADGSGNPAIAKMMNVTMKPLGDATDDAVKAAVTAGTGKMKPIAGVAAGDLDGVIAYVHTLKK